MSERVQLHGVSQAAFDLIVELEVSGEGAYNKRYRRPTRPGGASGITIGIGYDCGYSAAAQIRSDWGEVLPAAMVVELVPGSGRAGIGAARGRCAVGC
ncbi:hypothetical protein [Nitrobacter hamburgensis]|uniref:hypothetical protein n=1 Tax=Nitrobacter hamburgensis TaxID=912 RepID=UPI00059CD75D|nr:hypothetical protein [Nitrobacter hamburgensis]